MYCKYCEKKPVCTDPDYQLQEEVVLETGDDSTSSFCTGEEEVKKYPSTGHKEILGSVRWKKTAYQVCSTEVCYCRWENTMGMIFLVPQTQSPMDADALIQCHYAPNNYLVRLELGGHPWDHQ